MLQVLVRTSLLYSLLSGKSFASVCAEAVTENMTENKATRHTLAILPLSGNNSGINRLFCILFSIKLIIFGRGTVRTPDIDTTKHAKWFLHHFADSLELNKLTREVWAVRMCVCVCVYTIFCNCQIFNSISLGNLRIVKICKRRKCYILLVHYHTL